MTFEKLNNLGISETSIYRNIEAMRGKYLRRVGPDKGGFWEICFLDPLSVIRPQ